ncbi:hypothetical protein H5410_065017 [Solanum commersonii]|uniref:Uncharacterized protein n=1 Tax=Solanum commersonii TaxID=4109 RepID=A0A9J5VXR6_SOLCO|nr:hypothetical protein H5410_065017 [Solanum commersonii]
MGSGNKHNHNHHLNFHIQFHFPFHLHHHSKEELRSEDALRCWWVKEMEQQKIRDTKIINSPLNC